jgi:hypothetical protein
MTKKLSILILGLLVLMLAGCASMDFRAVTEDSLMTGDYEGATKEVEKKQESNYYKGKNSLLYYLDYGFLCHYAGLYEESNKALDEAERLSDELYAKSISREIGSYIINDKVKEYAGEEFEQLYVHIFKCLNYIALNNTEDALVEVRKANERMELLEQKYRDATDEYNANAEAGVRVPEADCHFHNSALSRYLGTVLFRTDKAFDDARIESEWLERSFAEQSYVYDFNLPKLPATREPQDKALLDIISFTGLCTVKKPLTFIATTSPSWITFTALNQSDEYTANLLGFTMLPSFGLPDHGIIRFEIPIMDDRWDSLDQIVVRITGADGKEVNLELLEKMNNISRDTYKRKMPLVVLKTALRVIGKKVGGEFGSHAIGKATDNSTLGLLSGLMFDAISAATENADTRCCFFLPAFSSTAEVELDPGVYDISIEYYNEGVCKLIDNRKNVSVEKGRLNLLESFRFQVER